MKQLKIAFCITLALMPIFPSWAADRTGDAVAAASPHGDKLAVTGALFRDDFMIMSFAETIADGETLHLQPKITSKYVSRVVRDGDSPFITPMSSAEVKVHRVYDSYQHGYDLKITPHLAAPSTVSIAIRVEGSEVQGFEKPLGEGGIGSPQTLLTGLDSKLLASIGKESHADWGCNTSSEGSSQATPCRYNLILTVDKDSGQ